MTTARPQQKPSMMDAAMSVMKRSPPTAQMVSMKQPATITEGKSSSMPAPFWPGCSGTAIMLPMMAA